MKHLQINDQDFLLFGDDVNGYTINRVFHSNSRFEHERTYAEGETEAEVLQRAMDMVLMEEHLDSPEYLNQQRIERLHYV